MLKVVISEQKSDKTKEEFNRLLIAYRIIPSSVMEVIDESFKSGYINVGPRKFYYCGYLMNGVGTPLRSDELKAEELASWVLQDKLPVRMQIQLHKILWGEKQGV